MCKSFAESAYKMGPGSAVRSKCEPLLSVFEGSDSPVASDEVWFGVDRAKNLNNCSVGTTKSMLEVFV